MRTLTPRTNETAKAEFHLTYACNLECYACSRGSFLKEPVVPQMTMEDCNEFFAQADALGWKCNIIVIGGEPTLHPQYEEIIDRCRQWVGNGPYYVQVYSNAYAQHSRSLLQISKAKGASVCPDAHKLPGSVMPVNVRTSDGKNWDTTPSGERWDPYVFVSPVDAGVTPRGECYIHGSAICGISVDHEGYAPCSMGGALGALLGGVGKTRRLADLFDPAIAERLTDDLCRNCGYAYEGRRRLGGDEHLGVKPGGEPQTEEERAISDARRHEEVRFYGYGEQQQLGWHTPMSPTWQKAFAGRR